MQLPEDVVCWVSSNFKDTDREQALSRLRAAVIHTGEPASPRLLRCVALSSGGDLERLNQQIKQLLVDWRDVIVEGEYASERGKLVRIRDLNNPISSF
jgi:hypothetical protein